MNVTGLWQKKETIKQTRFEHLNSFETPAREWYNEQIWAPKHAKNTIEILRKIKERGALDVARRINQYCTAIFDYAIIIGLCDNNPALG